MAPPTRACDDDVYNLSDAGSGAKDGTFFLISSLSLSLSLSPFLCVYPFGQKMKVGRVSRVTDSLPPSCCSNVCCVPVLFSVYN